MERGGGQAKRVLLLGLRGAGPSANWEGAGNGREQGGPMCSCRGTGLHKLWLWVHWPWGWPCTPHRPLQGVGVPQLALWLLGDLLDVQSHLRR